MHLSRVITLVLLVLSSLALRAADQAMTLTFDAAETAGICGMRPFWDRPVVLREDGIKEKVARRPNTTTYRAVWARELRWHEERQFWTADDTTPDRQPGALVFDAVHRSLLVRFPNSAQAIANAVCSGYLVEKVELALPFNGTEQQPLGYRQPAPRIGAAWEKITPRWHAVAWLLRKPWMADPDLGPTFNAYINGAGYWKQCGAADTGADRFPQRFGPAEISTERNETLDITPALTDPAYGAKLAERLTGLEDCGLIVSKWEIGDPRFAEAKEDSTGGIGIFIKQPRLIVTLRKDLNRDPKAVVLDYIPASPDLRAMAESLSEGHLGGDPQAVMPSEAQFAELREACSPRKPEAMPDWQWAHLQELVQRGGANDAFPQTLEEYACWVDRMLATPPSLAEASSAIMQLRLLGAYARVLPAPVIEHWKRYWASWLSPPFIGDQQEASSARERNIQTAKSLELDHAATLSALLGGHLIDSSVVEAKGRSDWEKFALRGWCWSTGTMPAPAGSLAVALAVQKTAADFGPTSLDRLLGRSALMKSVAELAGCYHPALHRFIHPMLADPVMRQDDLYAILHTLSPEGTLLETGDGPHAGGVFSPAEVAQQAMQTPWAPLWFANLIDSKPLPFEITATSRLSRQSEPCYVKAYLGHSYGLASVDLPDGHLLPVTAQWCRTAPVASAHDLGTLTASCGSDTQTGAGMAVLQQRNKLVLLANPGQQLQGAGTIRSLQTTLCLTSAQQKPTWMVCIDGRPVASLPVQVSAASRITIKDGVTYLGIIPLPASDLGRDAEIIIRDGGTTSAMLCIESYNYQRRAPLHLAHVGREVLAQAYGGFVLEMADVDEYPRFADFQQHLQQDRLEVHREAETLHLALKSGEDTVELAYHLAQHTFLSRRVNGEWPYLAAGIDGNTTCSQQGRGGRLEKDGAVLACEPGITGLLLTDPKSGTYAGVTPLPDATYWGLDIPGGIHLVADGKVSLLSATVCPGTSTLAIEYATAEAQATADMATALLVTGLLGHPRITLNGQLDRELETATLNGKDVLIIPLNDRYAGKEQAIERYQRSLAERTAALKHR